MTAASRDAIVIDGVSKSYKIGLARQDYRMLRDSVARVATAPVRLFRRRPTSDLSEGDVDEFWALRDVSLTIPQGDAVGFIGRNGAGKTTLLKILSRITEPSSGWAEVRGRVGSLLEVGTGFHPELTGRENVFLNGSILGMSQAETRAKFDEIVAFSGVERFIETPVKRYSSGMFVRLAFAVAAHLDPEILIVDEVLAVGDAEFQKRCIGKMQEVAGEGRTVLFVSHHLAIVQALCTRAVLLDAGRRVADGPTAQIVDQYLASLEERASEDLEARTDRDTRAWHEIIFKRVRIVGAGHGALATGQPAHFEFELTGLQRATSCVFVIHDHFGLPIASFDSNVPALTDTTDPALGDHFVCEIDELPLVPGRYRVDVSLRGNGHLQDGLQGAAYFDVTDGTFAGRAVTGEDNTGTTVVPHRWRIPPT